MSIKRIEYIEKALTSLGISMSDVQIIVNVLGSHWDNMEYWLAVAAKLRPSYFDETAFHAAELIYEAAIDRFHLTERLAGNYGVLLYSWGRLHEAIKWLEVSLELNPDYHNSRHNLAYCYELLEDYETAAKIRKRKGTFVQNVRDAKEDKD